LTSDNPLEIQQDALIIRFESAAAFWFAFGFVEKYQE
jgi:hypothetical protein